MFLWILGKNSTHISSKTQLFNRNIVFFNRKIEFLNSNIFPLLNIFWSKLSISPLFFLCVAGFSPLTPQGGEYEKILSRGPPPRKNLRYWSFPNRHNSKKWTWHVLTERAEFKAVAWHSNFYFWNFGENFYSWFTVLNFTSPFESAPRTLANF